MHQIKEKHDTACVSLMTIVFLISVIIMSDLENKYNLNLILGTSVLIINLTIDIRHI